MKFEEVREKENKLPICNYICGKFFSLKKLLFSLIIFSIILLIIFSVHMDRDYTRERKHTYMDLSCESVNVQRMYRKTRYCYLRKIIIEISRKL